MALPGLAPPTPEVPEPEPDDDAHLNSLHEEIPDDDSEDDDFFHKDDAEHINDLHLEIADDDSEEDDEDAPAGQVVASTEGGPDLDV